ncbi:MAG: peptidase T [Bulleidia sp.]|nr:peptidase T [Bulleidia sp.]
MTEFYEQVKQRLIQYAKINTESTFHSSTTPTTMHQHDLAKVLYEELQTIGVDSAYYDTENCVVYGFLEANTDSGKAIGFVTHMDTAPDASGENVKPWVLENYDGSDILLNKDKNIVMKVKDFPNLKNYVGQDLILTDGTTLLGGDDKASIAAVMTLLEHLVKHPEIKHNLIAVGFTPDEEVGGLARNLDLEKFRTPIAYTLDGDYLGYYEDETFNASMATIEIHGRSVHTGTAKGIMKNAVDIGNAFLNYLPKLEKPQYTEEREGFYHNVSFNGNCEHVTLEIIVRDHDALQFEIRNKTLQTIVDMLNKEYGEGTVTMDLKIQYKNLKEVIDTVPFMIPYLVQAIEKAGVEPKCLAFRGGTDGSALSHRGLPCPNLSAGYENAHGRFEYVPIQSMEKNVEILLNLIDIYAHAE